MIDWLIITGINYMYIDNVFRLLVRPSKWEKYGRLLQVNYIILFTVTDSGRILKESCCLEVWPGCCGYY